ncbi:MAG: DNA translocase FtsK [Campylobacteraceae bacterium]|nr:DNA translocase FtsK [Campylobacteraceae bacterium]
MIICIAVLIFFGIATIATDTSLVGSYGTAIGTWNQKIFGLFSYVYPFLLTIPIYFFYKHPAINMRKAEVFLAITLLFFMILMFQASVVSNEAYNGHLGYSIISTLSFFIGKFGVWVFIIAIGILSLSVIFGFEFEDVVAFIKGVFGGMAAKFTKRTKERKEIADNQFFEDKTLNALDDPSIFRKPPKKTRLKKDEDDTKLNKSEEDNLPKAPFVITEVDEEMNSGTVHVEVLNELAENKKLLSQIELGSTPKPKDYRLPQINFLSDPPKRTAHVNESEIDRKISDLLEKLRRFKIDGDVVRTYAGPVVTTFEFKPAPHIKVSKILTLQDDLAMALMAQTIRLQAPIPGKDVIGIEIPNRNIETIYLKEVLESEIFKKSSSLLTIALGKDIVGNPFVTDLKKLPHLLIAGTTGSGKSVGINAMLISLLYKNSPDTLRLMMIDPKMLEFSVYNDIPHLLTPVITNSKQAIIALSNMVAEMERRYKIMSHSKTKNIESYNEKIKIENGEIMPYIVVIIDELADLMMTSGKDVEVYIARLAQMSRAAGIHLVVATQRPSVDVVTGIIKANLPSRISYKVGQRIDSKVILDTQGAESLLGRGDMLFTPPGMSGVIRLHAPYTSEQEIERIVDYLKAQRPTNYDESFLKDNSETISSSYSGSEYTDNDEIDELFEEAKRIVLTEQKTSISYIQRRLQIGYNRAARIIEQLENMGILTPPNNKGQRDIVV